MCASDTTERPIEPFARSITDKEKELVLQLEKEVSSVVEVCQVTTIYLNMLHLMDQSYTNDPDACHLYLQAHPPHKVFCTQGTYVRYLRARQFNVHKASKMLKETLKWREQYKPEAITWDSIQSEAALNKVTILDEFDNEGRPIVFMRPRNEKQSSDNELKLKYVVYIMERASKIADESGVCQRGVHVCSTINRASSWCANE